MKKKILKYLKLTRCINCYPSFYNVWPVKQRRTGKKRKKGETPAPSFPPELPPDCEPLYFSREVGAFGEMGKLGLEQVDGQFRALMFGLLDAYAASFGGRTVGIGLGAI